MSKLDEPLPSSSRDSTLNLPPPTIGRTPEMRVAFSKLQQISRDCGANSNSEQIAAQAKQDEQEAAQLATMTAYRRVEFQTAKSIKTLRDELRMLNSMEGSSEYSKTDCDRMRQTIRRHANDLGKVGKDVMRLAKAEKCESDAMLLLGHLDKAKQAFRTKFHAGYGGGSRASSSGYGDDDDRGSAPINSLNSFQDYGSNNGAGGGGASDQQSLREDEEFQQFFSEVQQRDKIMDQQLDRIYNGVQRLNENALQIKSELEMQEKIIDEVTERTEATTMKIASLNKKLVKTIKQLDKSNMCIYLFCCIVLIGLIGGILYETGIFKNM